MTLMTFFVILFIVYLFYILYISDLKQECTKKKSKTECACLPKKNSKEDMKKERIEDPKDIVAGRETKDQTLSNIESIVDEYYSPFYNDGSPDINTKLSMYHSSYGSRDRDTKIGNHNMVYVKEFNKIHTPLLQYYENRNWFERDTQRDFDMFLK